MVGTQNTSVIQYYSLLLEGLGSRQAQVFETIKKGESMTNTEIAVYLQIPINQITPRTNELVKLGLVRSNGKRICTITHKNVLAWEVIKI